MTHSLWLPVGITTDLFSNLAQTATEQVCFLFSGESAADNILRVVEIYAVPPGEFERQSLYHVALADGVRGRVIARATQIGGSLIEVHTHPDGDPASFSHSDLSGLEEWVPHVRWRLRGRPYVALVFAEETFDGLVWDNGVDEPKQLGELILERTGSRSPTGITSRLLSGGRRDR